MRLRQFLPYLKMHHVRSTCKAHLLAYVRNKCPKATHSQVRNGVESAEARAFEGTNNLTNPFERSLMYQDCVRSMMPTLPQFCPCGCSHERHVQVPKLCMNDLDMIESLAEILSIVLNSRTAAALLDADRLANEYAAQILQQMGVFFGCFQGSVSLCDFTKNCSKLSVRLHQIESKSIVSAILKM